MEAHCSTQSELRSAMHKKADIIIIEGELAKKIQKSKQFQTAVNVTGFTARMITAAHVTLILGLVLMTVMGILGLAALLKDYDFGTEYSNGSLKFRAKK